MNHTITDYEKDLFKQWVEGMGNSTSGDAQLKETSTFFRNLVGIPQNIRHDRKMIYALEEQQQQLSECLTLLNKYYAEIHHGSDLKPLNSDADRKLLIGLTKNCTLPRLKELISFRYQLKLEDSVMDNTGLRIKMVKIYDEIMEQCPYEKEDEKYLKYREELATLLPQFMRMPKDERMNFLVEFNTNIELLIKRIY